MKVEFLDPAESEFIKAIGFYNGESEGLGFEFAAEVSRTIGRILEYPNAWARSYQNELAGVGRTDSHMVSITRSGTT